MPCLLDMAWYIKQEEYLLGVVMVRTIPKRIISILMVCILSFMLCLAVPKYQVKATIVGGMTIEIGMALIALLGAFGITLEFPDNLSDDEFLSAIGSVISLNKTYAQWREDIAITEEGKIFASQDLVTQVLTRFYNSVHTYDVSFVPVSAASGASVSYDAIDTRDLTIPNDFIFTVDETISSSNLKAINGSNFFYQLYFHKNESQVINNLTEQQWKNIYDYLNLQNGEHLNYSNNHYYYFSCVYNNARTIAYIDFYRLDSLLDNVVTSCTTYTSYKRYFLEHPISTVRYQFNPDGSVIGPTSINFDYIASGNYYTPSNYGRFLRSNLGCSGSIVFLSQGAVLDRFYDATNRSVLKDRIYSYIGSCVGLSIVQSATATDTITIGLQDDAIDYPVSGTGVVVDTGVIAQDLDGWVEGVQEKVVTRDIPSENESTRTRDFEISKVIASPTALDFTDTADYAAEESLPATYSANTNITLLNGIGSFFPFCIPFDLYEIFNGLNAPAQVPRFNWSIDFRSFGMGKHDFVIDLSDFATVCLIFKILTFIGFLIFLTLKTRDLIRG